MAEPKSYTSEEDRPTEKTESSEWESENEHQFKEIAFEEERDHNFPMLERVPLEGGSKAGLVFDGNLEQEYRRIFRRHRIDIAKLFYGKDGGYTLREFKKIYKIEVEENPEKYKLMDRKDGSSMSKADQEAQDARKFKREIKKWITLKIPER